MNDSVTCRTVWTLVVASTLCLAACAHLPDATVRYYLAESKVSFRVTRSYVCDNDDHLLITNAVTPSVVHSADPHGMKEVQLAQLNGTFSDTDYKFEFYDDGRLKSVNGSSTGQGESILKALISTAVAIKGFAGGTRTFPTECAEIKKIAADKPLTLTFEREVDLANSGSQPLAPDFASQTLINGHPRLSGAVGFVCASVDNKRFEKPIVYPTPKSASAASGQNKATDTTNKATAVLLTAREPASVDMQVSAGVGTCGEQSLWKNSVPVAQLGTEYELPLPLPRTFGKEALVATFLESGRLSSVQFTSNTGVGQGVNVLNAALGAAAPQTTAQKAEEIKAQADLIVQQQRLATCQADPKNCK